MKATRPRARSSHDRESNDRGDDHATTARPVNHGTQLKSAPRSDTRSDIKSDGKSNGDAKPLNPDNPPALAAPGTVEPGQGGQRTDEQLIAAYRGGDRTSFNE